MGFSSIKKFQGPEEIFQKLFKLRNRNGSFSPNENFQNSKVLFKTVLTLRKRGVKVDVYSGTGDTVKVFVSLRMSRGILNKELGSNRRGLWAFVTQNLWVKLRETYTFGSLHEKFCKLGGIGYRRGLDEVNQKIKQGLGLEAPDNERILDPAKILITRLENVTKDLENLKAKSERTSDAGRGGWFSWFRPSPNLKLNNPPNPTLSNPKFRPLVNLHKMMIRDKSVTIQITEYMADGDEIQFFFFCKKTKTNNNNFQVMNDFTLF